MTEVEKDLLASCITEAENSLLRDSDGERVTIPADDTAALHAEIARLSKKLQRQRQGLRSLLVQLNTAYNLIDSILLDESE